MADEKTIENENEQENVEIEDSFAKYFEGLPPIEEGEEEKKPGRKKKGPDILAVSDVQDEGMTINKVVAVDGHDAGVIQEAKENIEKTAPEEVHVNKPVRKKNFFERRTHKYAAVIGAFLIGLAIIGTVTVIAGLVSGVKAIADDSKKKEEFEWKIYPLLMLDPATFEDPMQLDEQFLLKTCMWQTVLENRTSYSYDDNMMLIVPASDLDVAARKLFGESVSLVHQSFSDGYEYFYIYDEENDSYLVPVSTQVAGYTPKIVKMTKDGDTYTVIAGYVPPTTLWNMSEDGTETEEIPEKYMYYIIEKTQDKNYVIRAVRDIPKDELPEDLEVASQFALNQGAKVNYDELYQEYLNSQTESETDIYTDTDIQTDTDLETKTDTQ